MKIVKPNENDLYVKMDLIVDLKSKEVVLDEKGDPYWIEFWEENARACKDNMKLLSGASYRLFETRDKRTEPPSPQEATLELDEYKNIAVDKLAYRVKAWYLPDIETGKSDRKPDFEKARSIFADDDHDLREYANSFLSKATFSKQIK